jgi:hypothetical protein
LDVYGTPNSGPEISKETLQPTMPNAPDATAPLIPGIVVTEDTEESPRAEAVTKTTAVPQTFRADDLNEEISKPQEAPNLPESPTTAIAIKLSKRRRFKNWVSQVLDSILPEADLRASGQPGAQRHNRLFK